MMLIELKLKAMMEMCRWSTDGGGQKTKWKTMVEDKGKTVYSYAEKWQSTNSFDKWPIHKKKLGQKWQNL